MLLEIQLLGIFFGCLMLYLTHRYSKKGHFTSREWLGWSFMWVMFMLVTTFPQLIDPLVDRLKLARAMDFFISLGFMSVLGLVFYIYNIIRDNQKKIESLNRELAYTNRLVEYGIKSN